MNIVPFLNPSQQQLANALDFDLSDFNCIAVVGNIGDNICNKDNSVTNNDIVNHNTSFDCAATIDQSNTATSESDNSTVTIEQSNAADQSDTIAQSNSVEQCNPISLPL